MFVNFEEPRTSILTWLGIATIVLITIADLVESPASARPPETEDLSQENSPPSTPERTEWTGDWIGWVYQDRGGDFPVRLHLSKNDAEVSATLDLPHLQTDRAPLKARPRSGGRLRLVGPSPRPWMFDAEMGTRGIEGAFYSSGQLVGEFELHRSPLPLPTVKPTSYEGFVGSYRFDGNRIVVIDRRFWGELVFSDSESGRTGTLLPLNDRTFFAGSAQYVPSPVEALVSFSSSGPDRTPQLSWQSAGQPPRTAPRLELREEEISFFRDGATLRGTVVELPASPAPRSGVVLLGGSDWSTRKDLLADARRWASFGVAALIYDKRGYGQSQGKRIVPFQTTADDAIAAVEILRGRADIDGDSVGITGTSRGGWHAPLAASRSQNVAFLVLFVAPSVSPAQQETTRRLNGLRDEGFDDPSVDEASAFLDEVWSFARDPRIERYQRAYESAREKGWFSRIDAPSADADWTWSRLNLHYDPSPALQRVRCPVLALYGERDRNVVPSENIPNLRRDLAIAENRDVTIEIIPDADHGLRLVEPDGTPRPLHRQVGHPPGLWPRIVDWVNERASR